MKKDPIKNLIQAWEQWDKKPFDPYLEWNRRFKDAGYFSVKLFCTDIDECERWCLNEFGEDHFVRCNYWDGHVFWFETEQASILFTLRWK